MVLVPLAPCATLTLDGEAASVKFGAGADGVTLIVIEVLPVEPPAPPEIEAPYMVTVVAAVTVGAVQLNDQESGVLVADEMWVISPLISCVVVLAVKVPAVAATSRPLFGVPLLASV